jgi:branched-chain amino acid transport system substrate-binding protein
MSFKIKWIVLVGASVIAGDAMASSVERIVRIGHVAPLSGPAAAFGKDNENGARMAIDELNAKGVTIGGEKVQFWLVGEDDAGDAAQAVAASQRLVAAQVSGVVGHMNSGTSIAASKTYSDAGIVQISPSATNPKYTLQGFKTTFRLVVNDVQQGDVLGRYATQASKAKRIAVVDDRTPYGQGLADEFVKSVQGAHTGADIVAREYTSDKATDFAALLTSIQVKKPDLVFFGGLDDVAGGMLQQMKRLQMAQTFMGGDGICANKLPELAAGSLADGQVVCAQAGGIEEAQKKRIDDFKAAYAKKFGSEVQLYAPYTYDAVMVMVEAMRKAGTTEPAQYQPALASIHYQGLTGMISFDPRGDVRNGALTLYTFKGGKMAPLQVAR